MLMKKLFTLFVSLWMAIASLFAANMTGGEVFYLTPHTTWNSDNARYAIYFFNNSTNQNTWVSMTKVEGESNLWKGTTPSGNWANLIFCRMNPSATANNWNNNVYWGGQTQDLTWDGTKNHFTVNSSKDAWNKPAGTWSLYVVDPIITVGAAPEFATTTVGETANATVTYTLENATEATATIEGEGFSIAEQSVGSVTITFAPEAEGEYTATLTITSGDVKETVAISATAVAPEAPKVPEILHVSAAEFAEITEGETTYATVTYELINAEEATATVEGEGFAITAQEVGSVTIEFTAATAGEYTGKLIIAAGEVVKEVALAATAKKAPVVITISFVNPDWTEAAFYAWGADGLPSTWPGELMTKGENGKFTYDLTLPENGTYNFIINNNNKGTQSVDMTGVTESTCYNLGAKSGDKYNLVVAENCDYTPAPEPEPIDPYVAIRGTMTNWDMANDIKMTYNADAANGPEWYITAFEVPADGKFKVVSVDAKGTATWYGTDKVDLQEGITNAGQGDGDIALPAGKYDIYFKVNEGRMWIQKYVEPAPEPVVITFVDDVTFPKTFVGETTNDIIEFTLENAAEDAEVVVEVTGEAFSVAEVQDNFIFLAFAPEAEGEYAGVLTVTVGEVSESLEFTAVASPVEVEPEPADPVINVIVADFTNNTTEVGDQADATIVYSLENAESATVTIEGEYVTFQEQDVDEGFMIGIFFTPEEVGEFPGKVIITAGEVTEEIEFTFIATEPEDDPIIPDPENSITFTVQVPAGTIECYVTGAPLWESGEFLPMEAVEGEENMFTITTTKEVINGTAWKYCSGPSWDYVEKNADGGDVDNRTVAGDPDVVASWARVYDPDFEPIDPYYAIRGLNGDASWTGAGDIVLEFDEDGNQYVAKGFTVTAGESFKVIYVDENAKVSGYYAGLEEGCNVGQTYDDMGNIVLPAGKYDLYFKPGTELMWISVVADTPTDAEEAVAELIYAIDGTIYAPAPFAIIDLAGKDVTNVNGALEGAYIVKTQNSVTKVLVK